MQGTPSSLACRQEDGYRKRNPDSCCEQEPGWARHLAPVLHGHLLGPISDPVSVRTRYGVSLYLASIASSMISISATNAVKTSFRMIYILVLPAPCPGVRAWRITVREHSSERTPDRQCGKEKRGTPLSVPPFS